MSDSAQFSGPDLTGRPSFAAGGHWIDRTCGIGPTEHKVSDTTVGGMIGRIWYCRACKAKKQRGKGGPA